MNFPTRHPLNHSFRRGALIPQADVILAIEMNDVWGALNAFSDRIVRSYRSNTKKDAKVITLGVRDLFQRSNYQDFARFQEVDLAIAGDGEASVPTLTEMIKQLSGPKKAAFEARGTAKPVVRTASWLGRPISGSDSGTPWATRICDFTRSMPVTSSVTVCSTWIRGLTSMK